MLTLLFFLIVYCFLLVVLYIGWKKTLNSENITADVSDQFISVVIPVRNEASNIINLLRSIKNQNYRNFEILLIDDHSEDETVEHAQKIPTPNLSIIKNEGNGKKSAITTGIKIAKGTIIATTDGDCIVPPTWLQTINRTFQDPQIVFGFGGVSLRNAKTFFSDLQAIEFSSLIGTSASTTSLNMPTMCNGANLAYRKDVFEEVKGYESNEHIASGDDEFLMRKILSKYPDGITFIHSKNAIVQSEPQPDLKSFFSQRVRWAAKWRFNTSFFAKLLAVFIFLTHLSVIASLIILIDSFSVSLASVLVVKVILEAAFLFMVSVFLNQRWNWIAFLVLQLIYSFYVIIIGIASTFIKISWKGRKIH